MIVRIHQIVAARRDLSVMDAGMSAIAAVAVIRASVRYLRRRALNVHAFRL